MSADLTARSRPACVVDMSRIERLADESGMSLADYLTMIERQIRHRIALARYQATFGIGDCGAELDELAQMAAITTELRAELAP